MPIDAVPEREVARRLKGAGIFLVTAAGEEFALPALEAMAAGCVVVSVPVQGAMEFLHDGENCVVAEPDALAERLAWIAHPENATRRALLRQRAVATALAYRPVAPAAPPRGPARRTARGARRMSDQGVPGITAVIVSRGLEMLLRVALEHLHRALAACAPRAATVVVVDDASATPYPPGGFGGGEHVLRFDRRVSLAHAGNVAVARHPGALYLLLNDDVLLAERALACAAALLARTPRAGICGSRLLYPDGTLQHGGVVFASGAKGPYHRDRGRPAQVVPRGNGDLQAVTGACMLVRHETWQELGGLDEAYPCGFADVDFCLRARQAGWRVLCCDDVDSLRLESMTPARRARPRRAPALPGALARAVRDRWLSPASACRSRRSCTRATPRRPSSARCARSPGPTRSWSSTWRAPTGRATSRAGSRPPCTRRRSCRASTASATPGSHAHATSGCSSSTPTSGWPRTRRRRSRRCWRGTASAATPSRSRAATGSAARRCAPAAGTPTGRSGSFAGTRCAGATRRTSCPRWSAGRHRLHELTPPDCLHLHHGNYADLREFVLRQAQYAARDVYPADPAAFDFSDYVARAYQALATRRDVEVDGDLSHALALLLAWDQIVRGLLHWDALEPRPPLGLYAALPVATEKVPWWRVRARRWLGRRPALSSHARRAWRSYRDWRAR